MGLHHYFKHHLCIDNERLHLKRGSGGGGLVMMAWRVQVLEEMHESGLVEERREWDARHGVFWPHVVCFLHVV